MTKIQKYAKYTKKSLNLIFFFIENLNHKIYNKYLLFKLENAFKVFTHLTDDEKTALYITVKSFSKPINAVEIGSYYGASSCFIAEALSKKSKLYCIDTWENDKMINEGDDPNDENLKPKDTYNEFLINTKKYKRKIISIRKWSTQAIDDVKKQIDKIDFLFIDGDHNYEGVKKDWELYSPLLKSGSVIAFHDTGWAKGVLKVIHEDVLKISEKIKQLPNMQIFKIK